MLPMRVRNAFSLLMLVFTQNIIGADSASVETVQDPKISGDSWGIRRITEQTVS